MKKVMFLILVLMLGAGMMGFAEKPVTLPDLTRPQSLVIDNEQFYVTEGAAAYIYSLKDYSLKTKFGQAGEGPQEFKLAGNMGIMVFPYENHLLVNSIGKISYFSKDGKYIKEIKTKSNLQSSGFFQPTGSGFVGMGSARSSEDQSASITISLFDEKMIKIKEIYRQNIFQRGRLQFPFAIPVFIVQGDRVFMAGENEFVLNVFDIEGNKLPAIKRDYKRLKVTDKYKEKVHHFFKTNPSTKAAYEVLKKMINFTDYFPAIQFFYVDEGKIYILTYLEEKEKYETFIYNIDGKFLKKVFLPFRYMNGIQANPNTIYKNKFYQLIENEETEAWELHAVKIE
jgi:hypothetical protein